MYVELDMTATPLQCLLHSTSSAQDEGHVFQLRQDTSKKSVFWLGRDNSHVATATAHASRDSLADISGGSLDDNSSLTSMRTDSPAEAIISLSTSCNPVASFWAIGGFQLVSNARSVQVYLTASSKSTTSPVALSSTTTNLEKEVYIMTSKGLPVSTILENGNSRTELHKVLCAIPGGPRSVHSLRLVFDDLAIGDGKDIQLNLQWMKLTARVASLDQLSESRQESRGQLNSSTMKTRALPLDGAVSPSVVPHSKLLMQQDYKQIPVMSQSAAMSGGSSLARAMPASPFTNDRLSSANHSEAPATTSDVAAAMAGLHFSLRHTEDRIIKRIESCHEQYQTQLAQQQQQYLRSLQQLMQEQRLWIQQQLDDQKGHLLGLVERSVQASQIESSAGESCNPTNREDKSNQLQWLNKPIPETSAEQSLWKQYALMDLK